MVDVVLYHVIGVSRGFACHVHRKRLRSICAFRRWCLRIKTDNTLSPSPQPITLMCFVPDDFLNIPIFFIMEIRFETICRLIQFIHSALCNGYQQIILFIFINGINKLWRTVVRHRIPFDHFPISLISE